MTNPSADYLKRVPERLVIAGFRNILAGYALSDVACWEALWQTLIRELGTSSARRLMGEKLFWVRCLGNTTLRPLNYLPPCCNRLCHDECMALALIAAAQDSDHYTGKLAARYLLDREPDEAIEEVWQASLNVAHAMSDLGQLMYPVTADVVTSIATLHAVHPHPTDLKKLN
jgi:hypothetical protein